MPVFNGYSYKPLSKEDAIRLIVLDPSESATASLTCRIMEYRRSLQDLDYSAVSYVWGNYKASQTLEIQCDEDFKYLRITPRVETVLKVLRDQDKPRYVWIDAICLNQSDEVEKARQIPLMGDIYKTAVWIDIWLGFTNSMTTRVLRFFRELSCSPDITKWRDQWEMAGRITILMRKYVHHDVFKPLSAISDFFEQPWFSRRWIIQEACLARHGIVHCGKQSIDLQLLSQAAARFQRMDMSDYAIKVAANLTHHTTELGMLEILWHFHESRCVEPKDRIAAFQGLTQDGKKPCLDYTKPWNVIYRDFAIFSYKLVDNDTRLQLLLHLFEFGPVSDEEDPSYPSWIPDWSSSRRRRLPYISGPRNVDTYEPYPKSPGHSEKAIVAFTHGRLQIHGDSAGTGIRSFRIASMAKSQYFHSAKIPKAQQASDVLRRLFPYFPNAQLNTVALAILLRTVSRFRHTEMERENTSKSLGRYEKALANHTGTYDCAQLLIWLRTLESVLHDFFLVELESSSQDQMSSKGYGISLKPIQDDDMTVPLWSLQTDGLEPSLHMSAPQANLQLFTMLLIRRNGEKLKEVLSSAGQPQEYRVIAPVTCVIWTPACKDSKRLSEAEGVRSTDCKRCISIQIT